MAIRKFLVCMSVVLADNLFIYIYIYIDLLAAIGLMPGGSVYVRMYTQQIQHIHKKAHRKTTTSTCTQNKQEHTQKQRVTQSLDRNSSIYTGH
jgi:hypothetical protein